jgi:thymidylate kinase
MVDQALVRSEYSLLFEALSEADIGFCLLRDDLRGETPPDDLDMLVDSARFDEALDVLKRNGYRIRVSERLIPFKTSLVKHACGHFIAVDLHREVVQGGIIYMDGQSVLAGRESVDDYFLPADSDLLAILAFHNVIGKRHIQEKHYSQIRALSERVDRETLRLTLSEYGTYDYLCGLIDDLDAYHREPDRTERLRDDIIKQLRRANPGLRGRRFLMRLRRRLRRRDPRPRAPLYAFLGVDGSGKSSLTAAFVELLNRKNGFPAVVLYMGPWGGRRLRFIPNSPYAPGYSLTVGEWFGEVFGRKPREVGLVDSVRITLKSVAGRSLTKEERALHKNIREQSRLYLTARMLRSLLRAWTFFPLITMEMYYRYWQAYRKRRRGTTVIADRYIYDLMTGSMRRSTPQYRRTRLLLCRLFPRPTRTFLLHADPETILARKDDLSPEMLRDFQAAYDEMSEKYAFETVETDQLPEALAQRLVERHYDELAERLRY